MTLHLLKLCVGAESIRDLEEWIERRLAERARRGEPAEHVHVTRMVPRRRTELIGGGSLYWVIKGQVCVRQKLNDVRPFIDADGVGRCGLVLEPRVVAVVPCPCRPFQGWRYLPARDAPRDLSARNDAVAEMPEAMRRDLRQLGLL